MRYQGRRGHRASRILIVIILTALVTSQADSAGMRPITVEDCIRTRRIVDQEVQVSPEGSRVAYVVKAPDVATNRNSYELYVRDLKRLDERENGRLLLQADAISGIRWLSPRKIIARVKSKSGSAQGLQTSICIVDTATGKLEKLKLPSTIEQYSVNGDGDTIVFSVKATAGRKSSTADADQQKAREERGYAIMFGAGNGESIEQLPRNEIYLAKKTKAGNFDLRKLYFSESKNRPKRSQLRNVLRLDLSPDGKYLLLVYSADSLPPSWTDQPYIKYAQGFGTFFDTYVLGLYEIESGQLRLGFNFPGALVHTRWSDDSRSYCVIAPSPFGTEDARAEADAAAASGNIVSYMLRFQHVFAVDVRTGSVVTILHREGGQPGNIKFLEDLPLTWKHSEGPMLVRADDNTFAWVAMQNEQWKETGRFDLWRNEMFLSSLASDGQLLVGVSQTTMIPPDLFVLDLKNKETRLLTDLNPQFPKIRLGQVEKLEWANRYGSKCSGMMIKPVGYMNGKRYPMIFLSAPPNDVFISDAAYTTAYAPQPLANAGFVVLIAQYPLDDKIPKGEFPGEMSDAYNWMGMVESAVDLLADRGIADRHNIGIAGFSRTSWLTDFTLTHSTYSFVAASSADSGIYTYSGYFAYNSLEGMKGYETQVGGPPYGDTLKYWLDYAPPFNAAAVRAAVLMEYTGTAKGGFEFFTALARLGKAVELYRYPKGAHPLDTPYERVASLQRNVDWFRFWMQGYEEKPPEYDPDQYVRWHKLREEQRWIDRVRAEGKDPSSEFLRETSPGAVPSAAGPAPGINDIRH